VPNLAVVGAQWGDEGKGKVVDLLADRFQVVARYQGGPNAGHTVVVDGQRRALRHIPSGAFRPGTRVVMGNGMVLDLDKLLVEIAEVEAAGFPLDGRFFISDRAHVILPPMAKLDALSEASPDQKIGTTQRGIGPTYEAKASRQGVRVADLADLDTLRVKVERIVSGPIGRRLREAGEDPGDPEALARAAWEGGRRLAPHVADTSSLLNRWIDEGASILFEGAQGTMLDIDHGSYPYVTSSSTTSAGLCAGLGIAPTCVHGVLGVSKAYATRVGAGPMPTELTDGPGGKGELLRQRGREFGTVTGRPRRCGWFDAVATAYATRLNRFDGVCVTLLDVLDVFDEIRVCVAYELDGKRLGGIPAALPEAERCRPVYETLPGWRSDTTAVRRWEELPGNARAYLDFLGGRIGAEVAVVGVGPDRTQSIVRPGSWLARTFALPSPPP
jgi:adenylosuccinate synthase